MGGGLALERIEFQDGMPWFLPCRNEKAALNQDGFLLGEPAAIVNGMKPLCMSPVSYFAACGQAATASGCLFQCLYGFEDVINVARHFQAAPFFFEQTIGSY
jgi:hypothetical protein